MSAQQFINDQERTTKIDVEQALQHAKEQLINIITQTGTQIAKSLEYEIRDKVIDQIGLHDETDERYGEMIDLQKQIDYVDEILSWLLFTKLSYVISKKRQKQKIKLL